MVTKQWHAKYMFLCDPWSICQWNENWQKIKSLIIVGVHDAVQIFTRHVNIGDVIKWRYLPRYWPFVRGIHRLVHFYQRLNSRLIKQSRCRWFERPYKRHHWGQAQLRSDQNGRYYADDIFECVLINDSYCIMTQIVLKCVHTDPIHNKLTLVKVIVCCRTDITCQGLYSLRRRRLIGIGIPIINLRRSDDRLMFIMGISILIRRCHLSE